MQSTLPSQIGTDRPTWGEWFKNLRVPARPKFNAIHADWVVIGLATVAQSFIVGFWAYTRFFVLPQAHEIPFGFQLAFAIIAGLALDAAVVFSATSGLEPADWNVDWRNGKPISLGGWATWTPFIAFAFSSLIAVDTFSVRDQPWNGSELLHIGWPMIVLALSKYGASLRRQRLAKQGTRDELIASLEKKLIETKAAADAMVIQAQNERRTAEQSAEARQLLLDDLIKTFKGTREQWEATESRLLNEREQAELRAENERTMRLEFTSTIDQRFKEAMDKARGEERAYYNSEIDRERLGWLGQLEKLNEAYIIATQAAENGAKEIHRLWDEMAEAKVLEATAVNPGKTATLRAFFQEFFEREGRDPTNKEIADGLEWSPVSSFDTLAGRVRGQRAAERAKAEE